MWILYLWTIGKASKVSSQADFCVTLLVLAGNVGVAADILGDLAKGNKVTAVMCHSDPLFKRRLRNELKKA